MHLRSDSGAGVRFLAAMREGRGSQAFRPGCRRGKETGYRWLRESFVALRDDGLNVTERRRTGLRFPADGRLGPPARRSGG